MAEGVRARIMMFLEQPADQCGGSAAAAGKGVGFTPTCSMPRNQRFATMIAQSVCYRLVNVAVAFNDVGAEYFANLFFETPRVQRPRASVQCKKSCRFSFRLARGTVRAANKLFLMTGSSAQQVMTGQLFCGLQVSRVPRIASQC